MPIGAAKDDGDLASGREFGTELAQEVHDRIVSLPHGGNNAIINQVARGGDFDVNSRDNHRLHAIRLMEAAGKAIGHNLSAKGDRDQASRKIGFGELRSINHECTNQKSEMERERISEGVNAAP